MTFYLWRGLWFRNWLRNCRFLDGISLTIWVWTTLNVTWFFIIILSLRSSFGFLSWCWLFLLLWDSWCLSGRVILFSLNRIFKIGISRDTTSTNQTMSSLTGDTFQDIWILEAKETVRFVLVTTLTFFVVIKKIPICASLTFLSRLTYLAILLNVVAEIALNSITFGSEEHLVVASETPLIWVTGIAADVTLLALFGFVIPVLTLIAVLGE
mgnify:CR=1 FL=1